MNNKIIDSTFISRRPLLPVIEFVENGKKIQKNISTDCVIVGRSKQCDICVDDDKLSRNHFMLVRTDGKFEIKDLNSSNGLIVNGKKVKKAILTGNDKIVAGTSSFSFVLTREDLNMNKVSLRPLTIDNSSFEKKYAPKLTKWTKKNVVTASAISILAFALTLLLTGPEKEAKVIPSIQKAKIQEILTAEQELTGTKLSEEDRVRALNMFKLAEYHFKAKNFALAKKSMEAYFAMVPNSVIAPAFIATCEEALGNNSLADEKLEKLEKESEKRELISKLLEQGSQALGREEFENAINIYSKILEIDEYNNSAYDGILLAQSEITKKHQPVIESTESKTIPQAEIYANEMTRAFKAQDYTTAFELANKIIAMGQGQSGRTSFLKAFRTKNKVISITNSLFSHMNKEASLLAKADAEEEAIKIYQRVLAVFPYQAEAKTSLNAIFKKKHDQAKLLYAKALVEKSYKDTASMESNLRAIISLVPASDVYHQKASRMLKDLAS